MEWTYVAELWFALKFVSLHKDKHLRRYGNYRRFQLWFALKFVSLHKDKHLNSFLNTERWVVICFKIRIFAQRQTSVYAVNDYTLQLWFALKFVSLHKDKHLALGKGLEPLGLWFALKFVSLHKDKHHDVGNKLIISEISNKIEKGKDGCPNK